MLISIVIPIFNAEAYLRRCLDSIQNQTYSSFEVILVNDGSTDNSGNICEAYTLNDSRFTTIHNPNIGAGASRNLGLSKTQGKWITFIDADDWIAPDYLDSLLSAALKESADAVFCNALYVSNDSTTKSNIYTICESISGQLALKKMLIRSGIRSELWGKLFKRDILGNIDIPTGISVGEDLLFLIEVLLLKQNCKIQILNSFLYYYNMTSNSLMRCSTISVKNRALLKAYLLLSEKYKAELSYYAAESSTFILRTILSVLTIEFTPIDSLRELLDSHYKEGQINLGKKERCFIRLYMQSPFLAYSAFHPILLCKNFSINKFISR